ncbi:GL21468 [Drosophila persimilis]|uniref:GL21468 n=1 Tax=Drosophila persimilis TaxID=7234 RepID=B4GDX7_DROPE|nr:GL21468 [Drosophila persimilis]
MAIKEVCLLLANSTSYLSSTDHEEQTIHWCHRILSPVGICRELRQDTISWQKMDCLESIHSGLW